ncbi:hypothetical protein QE152_g34068 [Popillia japonica]|uniref:Uncharacterized protein n=1 Tax=Popillia japonica TaxID=7064 RepID=A0AAW1IV45_POPJA
MYIRPVVGRPSLSSVARKPLTFSSERVGDGMIRNSSFVIVCSSCSIVWKAKNPQKITTQALSTVRC